MSLALISDVHGNFPALCAVLSKIDDMGISDIICLGDTSGYYSQINECCDELRRRSIFSLMGNHDWYLAMNQECPRSTSANQCLEYQRRVITVENKKWLSTLKPEARQYGIQLVHGGWHDPLDEYFMPSEQYFLEMDGLLFASGHTHVPCLWEHDKIIYCNPGSVGQPRDGDWRASFATFNGVKFDIHRVEYDYSKTQNEMKEKGFSSYFYENLQFGLRLGEKCHV